MKKKYIKIKWFALFLSGICFNNNKTSGSFSKIKSIGQYLINWNKLLFYFKYQISVIKNIILGNLNIIFVTDNIFYSGIVQAVAKKTQCFFVIGPWLGGRLTSLFWYNRIPGCIINCGLFYLKNLFNEVLLMNIPCINLVCNLKYFKGFGISYSSPLVINEVNSIYSICYFLGYIVKKYKKKITLKKRLDLYDYDLFFFNKLEAIQFKKVFYYKHFNAHLSYQFFRFKLLYAYKQVKKKNFFLFSFFSYLQNKLQYKKFYIPIYLKKKIVNKNKINKNKIFLFKTFIVIEDSLYYISKLKVDFIDSFLYKKVIFKWFNYEIDLFTITKFILNEF